MGIVKEFKLFIVCVWMSAPAASDSTIKKGKNSKTALKSQTV